MLRFTAACARSQPSQAVVGDDKVKETDSLTSSWTRRRNDSPVAWWIGGCRPKIKLETVASPLVFALSPFPRGPSPAKRWCPCSAQRGRCRRRPGRNFAALFRSSSSRDSRSRDSLSRSRCLMSRKRCYHPSWVTRGRKEGRKEKGRARRMKTGVSPGTTRIGFGGQSCGRGKGWAQQRNPGLGAVVRWGYSAWSRLQSGDCSEIIVRGQRPAYVTVGVHPRCTSLVRSRETVDLFLVGRPSWCLFDPGRSCARAPAQKLANPHPTESCSAPLRRENGHGRPAQDGT